MSEELVKQDVKDLVVGLNSTSEFEAIQRIAKLLASSNLVPKEFQNNIPNCVIALSMAKRLQADPLMVMQNLYIVYGRPSFSSTFLISAINSSGRFEALRYKEVGDKNNDTKGIIAYTKDRESGEILEGPAVTIQTAKDEGWFGKNGSKWKTMPDLMLRYRAATLFSRLYCPEITMGMQSMEEIQDAQYVDITNEPKEPAKTIDTVDDLKTKLKSEVKLPETNHKKSTENPKQAEPANDGHLFQGEDTTNYESPKEVIEKIKSFTSIDALDKWKKAKIRSLQSFVGSDSDMVMEALEAKEKELLSKHKKS